LSQKANRILGKQSESFAVVVAVVVVVVRGHINIGGGNVA
jgi:hypothetical protein